MSRKCTIEMITSCHASRLSVVNSFLFYFSISCFLLADKGKKVNRKQFHFLPFLKFTINDLEWLPMVNTVGNVIIQRKTVESWVCRYIILCLISVKVIVYARCCEAENLSRSQRRRECLKWFPLTGHVGTSENFTRKIAIESRPCPGKMPRIHVQWIAKCYK